MGNHCKRITMITLSVIALFLGSTMAMAAGEGLSGWEVKSEYNKYYKISEMDEFRADVVEITELIPMPGMDPAIALKVLDRYDEEVIVHLGPKVFVKDHSIRPGDDVKIRGAWAEIQGKEVFMASKIKKKKRPSYSYKVRLTSDGTPFWTMSDEQIARERASGD
jgi:hypothetical protein